MQRFDNSKNYISLWLIRFPPFKRISLGRFYHSENAVPWIPAHLTQNERCIRFRTGSKCVTRWRWDRAEISAMPLSPPKNHEKLPREYSNHRWMPSKLHSYWGVASRAPEKYDLPERIRSLKSNKKYTRAERLGWRGWDQTYAEFQFSQNYTLVRRCATGGFKEIRKRGRGRSRSKTSWVASFHLGKTKILVQR